MANVLIVEDAESVAAAHAYSLWESGHTVSFAYTAKEAGTQFQTAHHDVVLLDFDLPDGTGLEVFRELRKINPEVCVIMVTGKGDERLAAQILKEGADDYLTKSSNVFSQIPDAVNRVLKEKASRRQLAEKEKALQAAHDDLAEKVALLAQANDQLQHEIEERIRTEEALKESNTKLKSTLEELGRSQAQMLQSEKLASVGQLAAGVAHEINNPTGFISSNLYTLTTYLDDLNNYATACAAFHDHLQNETIKTALPESVLEMTANLRQLEHDLEVGYILEDSISLLAESRNGAERIRQIVADLKDFAHPGKAQLEYVDINKNILSTINLVWNELKYKTEIEKQLGDLPLVQCYPQMISQVFMNLLINAAQAIEDKGIITISTRVEGDHAIVKIADNGNGIPRKDIDKIFDPFFTTKPVGQGTGLGLRIVYDIIQKHKGTIQVESTEGVGTTFAIRLPI